ncbi:Leucine-rich repeat-containing protein 49 [Acipenser ruthenus]|uniref:Leucine-rich repeat-containing protein 49 n=1 Tax=Acipenser ruthenus TaxID=7906 RepID=A0A444UAU2_ACIRT|nr:Leucine-rich repeat-containing protein 49 [Acipenser ruthenus]
MERVQTSTRRTGHISKCKEIALPQLDFRLDKDLPSHNREPTQDNLRSCLPLTEGRLMSTGRPPLSPKLAYANEHFVKSLFKPGTPVFLRSPEDSAANPDRLDLDRRNLLVCPLLEGEENLRLLNFQHNLISEIQHLSHLRRLIFLDLYDNHITEISGLSALTSLRVLMLGTNRISRISGLESLSKLDVLDLHGNQVAAVLLESLCVLALKSKVVSDEVNREIVPFI